MSAFSGSVIFTNSGRNLQAKVQSGIQLNFTRIALGDGDLSGTAIGELTALKHQVKSCPIERLKPMIGGKAVVGTSFSNHEMATAFYWKELGIFAQDPDLGEVLYCYGNAGANAEYIPAGGGTDIIEKSIDVVIIVGNAPNVTATIDASLIYASVQELDNLSTRVDSSIQELSELSTRVESIAQFFVSATEPVGLRTSDFWLELI